MLFKNKFCTKLLLISAFFSIASFSYADGGLLFLEKNLKASKVENSKQKQVKNNESNESNEQLGCINKSIRLIHSAI